MSHIVQKPPIYESKESFGMQAWFQRVWQALNESLVSFTDVDDVPVDGATTDPISSNWAFDHVAAADPHPGYLTATEGNAAYDAIGAATAAVATHAALADPHTGYRLESADHTHQSTGLQAGTLDHGLALTGLGDDDHTQYLLANGTRTLTDNLAVTVLKTIDGRDLSVDGTKLDGIESGATADQTAAEILAALITVDGTASGLDADLLDGSHASAFQPVDADLTTIAGLTATTDNFLQAKVGAWASRTVAQVKTDLNLTGTNSGDQTSIVGITGTTAQFNAALSDGDFTTGGGTATGTNSGDQTITLTGGVTGSGTGNFAATVITNANLTGPITSSGNATTLAIIDAKGDLIVGTAADTGVALAVGAAGTVPMARSAATSGLAYAAVLNKGIYGLTYDNGTDTVNDININVGGAMDATGAYWMTLGTVLGKQLDAAWAVGGTTVTPLGGLDTGIIGNNDYYIWLIARSDTGVVDALFSLSSTAPTMPANYNFKRLIGWFKRVGAAIVAFKTYETEGGGLELLWTTPTLDVNLANTLTTTRRTDAVKVPLNFSVIANLNVYLSDISNVVAYIYCPDQADLAPSNTAAPLFTTGFLSGTVGSVSENIHVRTSAAGLIAARASTTSDLYAVATIGLTWERRN